MHADLRRCLSNMEAISKISGAQTGTPSKQTIEFEALINICPKQQNISMEIVKIVDFSLTKQTGRTKLTKEKCNTGNEDFYETIA